MLKNKKSAVWIVCAAIVVCLAAAVFLLTDPLKEPSPVSASDNDTSNTENTVKIPEKLDLAVSNAVLEYNHALPWDEPGEESPFPGAECIGEGHIILETKETDGELTAYIVYSLCEYHFVNDNLMCFGESVAIPSVIKFDVDDSGNYIFKSQVDTLTVIDTLLVFPKSVVKTAVEANDDEELYGELREQRHEYAREFLKKTGREAEVGTYDDFDIKSWSDYGVSQDLCDRFFSFFPEYFDVGRVERVENGVRYVYETSWDGDDNGNGIASFWKHKYGSEKIIEKYRYEITNGESFTKLEGSTSKHYSELNDDGTETYYWDDGRVYTK